MRFRQALLLWTVFVCMLAGCSSATPTVARPVPVTPSAELAAAIVQARSALEQGDSAGVIALLEQPLADGQGTSEAHYLLGNAYADQEHLSSAQQQYERALALDAGNIDARANLGVVLYRAQQLSEAEAVFREALTYAPDDAEIHYNLGGVLASQGKLQDAVTEFRRANELDADLAEPYLGLGSVYQLQGENELAISALQKYLELSKDPVWRAEAQRMLDALVNTP